jgi:2,4-dienoyl-CoA reductase (NADPH2)
MYPRMFSPIEVGGRTLRNRVLLPAMDLHYTPDGAVNDRLVAFYRARSKGPALVVVGGCRISREAAPDGFIGLHEDRFIPGLKRLVDAIREGGAVPVAQLFHAGRYLRPSSPEIVPLAPSAVASRLSGVTPRAMTGEDIGQVIRTYTEAARRALEAGFEGVEIIGSAGYLPAQFASPVTNRRDDGYGGDLAGRSRFARELVGSVRAAAPQPALLFYRMGFSDMVPGGLETVDAVEFAKLIAAEGLDLLSLTGGWHEAPVPMITMDVSRGAFLPEYAPFKRALSIPVAGANRINRPEVAERALERGQVDMVAVGRALLADPDWVEKSRRGKAERIIPCTACNEGCLDRIFRGRDALCALNPLVGFEESRPEPHAAKPSRIAILGAGPAGLCAALWLARSGHSVTVFDTAPEPGGLLKVAHLAPGKSELRTFLQYLLTEAAALDVQLFTSWKGSPPPGEPFGALVLAVGRAATEFPGERNPSHRAYSIVEAFRWKEPPPGPGAVIGGGETGVEMALHLAHIGAKVSLIHRHHKLAADLGPSTRWVVLKHLQDADVPVFRGEAFRLTPAVLLYRGPQGEEGFLPARWSVWAGAGTLRNTDELSIPGAWKDLPKAYVGEGFSQGRLFDWTVQAYDLAVRWEGPEGPSGVRGGMESPP